jgi:MoaA/NifB/PqqE/SkfB family radical SAM enzyme
VTTIARSQEGRPTLPLLWLDTLWVQVSGTVCNIACKHCFISCGPKVETHRMMTVEQVRTALDDGVAAGMRSVWYTGGEPLLHPALIEIVDLALARTPLGVLTNGMGIDEAMAEALGVRFRDAPYNLEIRVSLDGPDAETNDRVRGNGVFAATCAGIARLAAHGVEPVVAVALVDGAAEADQQRFADLLRGLGVRRPRVRWIPPFRIGREATRKGGRAYQEWERLTEVEAADPEAPHRLQCGTSRCVTAEGAFPCPILINEPAFRLGDGLKDALRPHPVDHRACHTCWVEGFSCSA